MKTKVLIVEDEMAAAKRLIKMIKEYDESIIILDVTDSVQSTIRWLKENPDPDLIFLDIHLADGSGFRIFEEAEIKSPVIFTTAYDQYAVKAFRVNSIDYLLKPLKKEELAASIERYRSTTPASPDIGLLLDEIKRLKSDRWQQKFVVQYADKLKAVKASEIAYFEAREKSVFLVTGSGTGYAIDYTLDKLETVLEPSHFFRVNRKFIVNFGSIRTMHLYPKSRVKVEIIPKPDQDVIVSSERSARFREWLTR